MNRYVKRIGRIIITAVVLMIIAIGVTFLVSKVFDVTFGLWTILFNALLLECLMFVTYWTSNKSFREERDHLASDLELKEILYDLLYNTSSYEEDEDLYDNIIKAAIQSVPFAEKGTILDVRNPSLVKYVAISGFDKEVLVQMKLSLSDTYLFKETHGALDRTVIIKNSVDYNKLHANEDYVEDLIKAGTAGVQSTMCTPISVMGEVMGMINIDSGRKDAFSEEDIHTLEIFALEVGKMIQFFEVMKENLYLSQYDGMTKLYNRSYFYELHQELYNQVKKEPYIFIATDLNNLKEVNDTFGHSVGDKLITHYASAVRKHLDATSIVGRYGGDEFNILMPNRSKEDAQEIIEKIEGYLKTNPIIYENNQIYVSFSYGIVRYPDDEKAYEALIILADQRMYEHKSQYKNG